MKNVNNLWTKKDNIMKYMAFSGDKKVDCAAHLKKIQLSIFVD
jgi:hypothetical protein